MAEKNEKNQPYEGGDQKEGMGNIQDIASDKTKEKGMGSRGEKDPASKLHRIGKMKSPKVEANSQRSQYLDVYDSQQGGFLWSKKGASDLVKYGDIDKK